MKVVSNFEGLFGSVAEVGIGYGAASNIALDCRAASLPLDSVSRLHGDKFCWGGDMPFREVWHTAIYQMIDVFGLSSRRIRGFTQSLSLWGRLKRVGTVGQAVYIVC